MYLIGATKRTGVGKLRMYWAEIYKLTNFGLKFLRNMSLKIKIVFCWFRTCMEFSFVSSARFFPKENCCQNECFDRIDM